MKAIHGGKAKHDKIDSHKIASLLRGGLLPQAYVYPTAMRSTRDLLRRRLHLVRKRGRLLAHIQNTRAPYNLPAFEKRLAYPGNRDGVVEHFPDPSVRKSIEVDADSCRNAGLCRDNGQNPATMWPCVRVDVRAVNERAAWRERHGTVAASQNGPSVNIGRPLMLRPHIGTFTAECRRPMEMEAVENLLEAPVAEEIEKRR